MHGINKRPRPSLSEWHQQIRKLKKKGRTICPLMTAEKGFWPELCVCDIPKTRRRFLNKERRSRCSQKLWERGLLGWLMGKKDRSKLICLARTHMRPQASQELSPPSLH